MSYYFELSGHTAKAAIKFFENQSNIKSFENIKVFEIGSRTGKFALLFKKLGAKVLLSDVKNQLHNDVREEINNSNFRFKILDPTKCTLGEKFDLVIIKSVLGSMSDIDQKIA